MTRIYAPEEPKEKESFGSKTQVHQRYYAKDGKQVPGATTVLQVLAKPALISWAWKLGLEGIDYRKHRDEAAAIGTLAHYLVQCRLSGEKPDLDNFTPAQVERAKRALRSFYAWVESHKLQPRLLEAGLVSNEYRFGGTVDFYGGVDEIPTLLDFKTSSGIYEDHKIQVSGYRQLLIENGYPVKGVRILRIGRDDDDVWEEHILSEHQLDLCWGVFQHALQLYELMKALRRKEPAA